MENEDKIKDKNKEVNYSAFYKRLQELYHYIAGSYQEFHRKTGIPKTSLNSYLKKNRPSKPGSEFFIMIKNKFPEVDLNYIFTGMGSLLIPIRLKLSRTDEPEPEYSDHSRWTMVRNHQELMEAHKELIQLLHKRLESEERPDS